MKWPNRWIELDYAIHDITNRNLFINVIGDHFHEINFQVHRALKHAVNAGLLRHRSGRYKALFTLNPAPVKQPLLNERNEGKSVAGVTVFDADQPTAKVTSDRKEENR